ncbi:MAG: metallophosphoesterase [Armatimonadota bacterium]|jgi:hypothetical protein
MKRHAVLIIALVLLMAFAPVATAELEPAPDGSFTIAVIPDTQGYRGRGTKSQPDSTDDVTNPNFSALTPWIVDNLESQRIVFVTHVGDIVDINNHDQWQIARECMDHLHGVVPYGISVGNHDMTSGGDSSLFQEYFGAERFARFEWYGGAYDGHPELGPAVSGNNANSYQLLSAEGVDLILLHLECNAPDDVLEWAGEVLQEHSDRPAFITTHMYLGPLERPTTAEGWYDDPKGRMLWRKIHGERGNTPEQLWEKLFSRHPNILIVQAGDQSRTQSIRMHSEGEHGNIVHQMVFDYGGGRNIRLLRFIPAENRIEAITWDTQGEALVESSSRVEARDQWQFVIEHDFGMASAVEAVAGAIERPHPALKWFGRPMVR